MSGCLANSSVSVSPLPDAWILLSMSVEEGIAYVAPFECCWRNSGAVFLTAPIEAKNLAQLQAICAIVRAEVC